MLMTCLLLPREGKKITTVKKLLSSEFDMKDLGVAKKILGMEITRDRKYGLLFLSQHNYIKKVLHRFNMHDSKPVSTLIAPSSEEDVEYMSKVTYSSAVGSWMYAMVCSHPDLSYAMIWSVDTCLILVKNPGRQFSGFSGTSEEQQILV